MKKPPEYNSWRAMRDRCNRSTHHAYKNYGGRGISVCDRWDDFQLFLKDMGERPNGYTIDRINNDGDYEPSNCRWLDRSLQNRNRRSNHLITYKGVTKTMQEWAERYGINKRTLWQRISIGLSPHEAFTNDLRRDPKYVYKGNTYNLKELAKVFGVRYGTMGKRIHRGVWKGLSEIQIVKP